MDERRISELAATQHGLVTVDQAAQAGATHDAIAHAVRVGRWSRVARGVLATGQPTGALRQRIMAAVLRSPPAWASHSSAARLWGWEVRHSEVEMVVSRGRRVQLTGIRVHHSGRTEARHFTMVDGIPVTTPQRTLLDLSGRMPIDHLAAALDSGLRRRLMTLDDVASSLDPDLTGSGRRPHTLIALVEQRRTSRPCESVLEARVLRVLEAAGIPAPRCHFRVRLGGRTYRLDFAWPHLWVFLEADGFDFHAGRRSFDEDRRRQNALITAGWACVRVTSAFTDAQIVAAVRGALGRATRRPAETR
ncbi:MAG: type IV toxin-antitoxin system AbiEi family antitoxin domain-containing protein [Microthrixaceae bacterium]